MIEPNLKEADQKSGGGCVFFIAIFFALSLVCLVVIATTKRNKIESGQEIISPK